MKEIKRLTRCKNGHFFDGGKYEECPHCNNNSIPNVTTHKKLLDALEGESVESVINAPVPETDIKPSIDSEQIYEQVKNVVPEPVNTVSNNDSMTMHYYQRALGTEPVVGWVVCVEGVHFGEDFKIKSGRNFIGRSGNMNICLSGDKAISRERHAILTYDPKGNVFMIQPGDSSELCYLNGQLVLIPTPLKAGDRISLGESELMFVPFCSESFTWEK